jgi:hypothetical protein
MCVGLMQTWQIEQYKTSYKMVKYMIFSAIMASEFLSNFATSFDPKFYIILLSSFMRLYRMVSSQTDQYLLRYIQFTTPAHQSVTVMSQCDVPAYP